MKILKLLSIFLIFSVSVIGMTPQEILKKVDYNMAPNSVEYKGKMVIYKNNKEYTKEMKIYGKGSEKSFVEFLSPARDKGTKYLRIRDNMWMYLPRANRTIKISGHMLRQSMMGSDFSYEDQTSRNRLNEIYESKILKETNSQYIMELIKKDKEETTYYKRKVWINKSNFITEKSEMYAKSGKLLKEMEILETKKIGDRVYPTVIRMEDMIRKDSYTNIVMTDIKLDVDISDEIFTLRYLERR